MTVTKISIPFMSLNREVGYFPREPGGGGACRGEPMCSPGVGRFTSDRIKIPGVLWSPGQTHGSAPTTLTPHSRQLIKL